MLQFKKVSTANEIKITSDLAYSIWNQHFSSILSSDQIDYMVDKYQSVNAITEQLKEGYEYYIFHLDDTDVGYFAIQEKEDNTLFLSKIYLKKEYRKKGYAKQAFEFIKNVASKNNNTCIWLTVNVNNTSAIDAYEKWGMQLIKREATEIGNNFIMDDYIYGYSL